MARRKKFHGYTYEKGSLADVAITGGTQIAKGIGKLGALVKDRAAKRHLPENLARLTAAIEEFQPLKKYRREFRFQNELYVWLKAKLPGISVTIEETQGRSRPDIVVDRVIAIEIKGPTPNHQLDTIADKAVRYGQHYERLVCVLFDVQDEGHYREWEAGMRAKFPDILIFRR